MHLDGDENRKVSRVSYFTEFVEQTKDRRENKTKYKKNLYCLR